MAPASRLLNIPLLDFKVYGVDWKVGEAAYPTYDNLLGFLPYAAAGYGAFRRSQGSLPLLRPTMRSHSVTTRVISYRNAWQPFQAGRT